MKRIPILLACVTLIGGCGGHSAGKPPQNVLTIAKEELRRRRTGQQIAVVGSYVAPGLWWHEYQGLITG